MAHEIETVEAFRFRGNLYESFAKANEAAETLVFDYIRPLLLNKGFTVSECVKVMDAVMHDREQLAELLDY